MFRGVNSRGMSDIPADIGFELIESPEEEIPMGVLKNANI